MFCEHCHNQVEEGIKFCPYCGEKLQPSQGDNIVNDIKSEFADIAGSVKNTFNELDDELVTAAKDVNATLHGQPGEVLKTDRGLLTYILLSIITCGIYGYYFIYQMAHDINIACEGDGEQTSGLAAFIILSFITCGFYSIYWEYKLGNRLASNAHRYGLNFQENGTTVLLWVIFGSLLCCLGPFIGMNILIRNSNTICRAYNEKMGYV